MNPKVEAFLSQSSKWQKEFEVLRNIVAECGMTEELKWGKPCYSINGKNVVLIHGFKDYCALLFHKGALLKDPEGILVQQTKNVQAARQLRFTSLQEIWDLSATVKAYVFEAIEVERAGLEVKMKPTSEFIMVEEFQDVLASNLNLKTAFESLTPGRQRAYLLFFSSAKQSKTRSSRIEKCIPKMLEGKGLND
ncbi:YdeI family protein [Mangrovimonas sp. DI 80]|uniref:YdeI/OmpD-associated family protein n=1 Tax=Mangrovimonas sp. DI 80 TaxID=1779330 RepID=UPI000976CEAA|nr:YdeI family protein [Mangrovimonas sp. DI 80]OMP30798.1 hypothetical protein BKM32_11235 [Mangrovimonas sp. DI 80]